MKTEDYNYKLNKSLIAQTPLKNRESSKLMTVDKQSGDITHESFVDIIKYLNKGDALVLNNTKVMPSRLIGLKQETGALIEVLLLKDKGDNIFESLVKPQKRLNKGTIINFDDKLKAEVIEIHEEGITNIKLIYDGILLEILNTLGQMPLPPYITEKLNDDNRYQTVYASKYGSSAAPTAGLHFTEDLLNKIKQKGIHVLYLTLHVGIGTFRPVVVEDILNHKMHTELYEVSKETCDILNKVKKEGGKIIAVGTTTVRTLETLLKNEDKFKEGRGETDIFIYPGYNFKAVDKIITNFHLPKSTLLMLVSAFSTKEIILRSYKEATDKKYRFFSFGDAMFLI